MSPETHEVTDRVPTLAFGPTHGMVIVCSCGWQEEGKGGESAAAAASAAENLWREHASASVPD